MLSTIEIWRNEIKSLSQRVVLFNFSKKLILGESFLLWRVLNRSPPPHNGKCSSQRRFGSLLLRSRDRNRWPFMSLIAGWLTNTSRWQPITEGHFRHGWFPIDAKKRDTIWKYLNLFKFFLCRWVIFPYYVLSNAVPPPSPALKHIGLFFLS